MPFDREHAVPGVVYTIGQDANGKVAMDDRLQANLHKYQLYTALLQGGDYILNPPSGTLHPITGGALRDNSYLDRLPAESIRQVNGRTVDPFWDRVKRSAHEPIAETIISIYVDTLFRQPIDRSPVRDAIGDDVYDDIDLRGHSAPHFLAFVYAQALALGWGCVITDMPRVELDEVPSRLHELAQGRRPYCRWLPPTRIWQWEQDSITGEFVYCLVHESANRYRMWMQDSWVLIDDEAEVIDSGTHNFGRVPIDIFVVAEPDCDDVNAPLGISAIRSSALMQLQVDQHASLLDDLMRKTNFPFLHVREDSLEDEEKVEQDTTLGADYIFAVDGDVEWIAPPAVCAQETRNHIDRLESRIYKAQGVHRRSQDSVEAHSGLALDYEASPIYATVQSWAQRLHSFELRLWQTIGRALGVSVPANGVHYPEDFSVRPIDLELSQSRAASEIYGGYNSAPTHIQKYIDIKVGRAAERDISYLAEYQGIIDEKNRAGEAAESQAVDPGTALNGAQVASMLEVITGVATRALPRDTGVQMLVAAFPIDLAAAEQIMGDVGVTFFASVEPATAPMTAAPPSVVDVGAVVDSTDSEGDDE